MSDTAPTGRAVADASVAVRQKERTRACHHYDHQPSVPAPSTRTGGGVVSCELCKQNVKWCIKCGAWCRMTSVRAWSAAHGSGLSCGKGRATRRKGETKGERKVAKAGSVVDQAICVDGVNPNDVQDIAPDEKMDWDHTHLSLDAPRAGLLCASSSVLSADVDAASKAVLGFATDAVAKMLTKEERKDMSTSRQAGSLPSTLDHRVMPPPGSTEEPAEEVAKCRLWQLMLDALAVSSVSQQEAARWVKAFATDIAGM